MWRRLRASGSIGMLVVVLMAAIAGLSAGGGITAVAARQTALPPLIPRAVLFGNPERINPGLSPDGKYLTYRAPDARGVLQVWIRTVGQQDDRPLTADQRRGIPGYFWSFDGAHLIYVQDAGGDENFHLYAVNIHTGESRDLTPFPSVQAQLVARNPAFPNELLVALNLQDRRRHDVYRLNLETADLQLDTENPGTILGWVTDQQFQVRAANAVTPDGGRAVLIRDQPGGPFRVLRQWPPDETGVANYFTRGGSALVMTANHNANALRMLSLDLATGEETVLVEDPEYDVFNVITSPRTGIIQLAGFYRDRIGWQALDPEIAADLEAIAGFADGEWNWLGRDLADTTWLIASIPDDGPLRYFAYDRRTRTATFLFSSLSTLENLTLAPKQSIAYTARDGLTIHGYLSLPPGVPAHDLPAVLLVHGGPWARDFGGYDPQVQWLANRGYAVLQVNFRGSTGYGKAFLEAGNGEWGAKMHDDLIDGVNWLVDQGIADRQRVGIMGGSYGGYAVLTGLTFTPEVFAAGVNLFGISDLVTLLQNRPPEWGPGLPVQDRRIGGDQGLSEQFLRSRSPLYYVDRIQAPLLIGQGANDRRVPPGQSDQIVAAMRATGLPVDYLVYAEEGHGFARPANRFHFFAAAEEFLATHLGGRFEPGGEIPGHTGERR